jgi:hypothetical protein
MGHVRRVIAVSVSLAAISVAGVTVLAPAAGAVDNPTFRDCSFVGGLDPDYVRLFDTTNATVTVNQHEVDLLASESTDPMDSSGGVTITASISSPGIPTQNVKGASTGAVLLDLPLLGTSLGRTYTIAWAATFDSGHHPCPGTTIPTTTGGAPFTVRVVKSAQQV